MGERSLFEIAQISGISKTPPDDALFTLWAEARGCEVILARRYQDGRLVLVDRFSTIRSETAAAVADAINNDRLAGEMHAFALQIGQTT